MSGGGRVVIIGQGYVGLPVSKRAVDAGFDVVGFDVDEERVARLCEGRSFIEDVTETDLREMLATGRFQPTSKPDELTGFDFAIISVPTPLRDGTPDLSYIESAGALVGGYVTAGSCVILESTTYPGTTQDLLVPVLEDRSGLRAGRDFHVGYSPERIDPGNPSWGFYNTPKLVSGLDEASLDVVDAFYSKLVETTVRTKGLKEAELAKLLENTFRHVNIALVNELAIFARDLDIDVWDVVDAASSKPFGFMKFTPGPGVGGHCLPIDPSYLSWKVRRSLGHTFRFVELANDVNEHMPDYVVGRVAQRLNVDRKAVNGACILAIGLSYKKNTADARESPALMVIDRLLGRGAEVLAVDPMVAADQLSTRVKIVDLDQSLLDRVDLILVLTDHDDVDWAAIEAVSHKVVDTRRRVTSPGVEYL